MSCVARAVLGSRGRGVLRARREEEGPLQSRCVVCEMGLQSSKAHRRPALCPGCERWRGAANKRGNGERKDACANRDREASWGGGAAAAASIHQSSSSGMVVLGCGGGRRWLRRREKEKGGAHCGAQQKERGLSQANGQGQGAWPRRAACGVINRRGGGRNGEQQRAGREMAGGGIGREKRGEKKQDRGGGPAAR